MRPTKYRCPHCGNTNLMLVVETTVQRNYKLRLDGDPYKRQQETVEFANCDAEKVWCPDCNCDVDFGDGHALKKWCNPEYKPAKKRR